MNIGFAMCGSFCTFSKVFPAMETLATDHKVIPIFSTAASTIDSRFGEAKSFITFAERVCNRSVIHSISDAEPIGPKKLLDALVIAPCTGNTLSKMAAGITDSSVTMAAKAHQRNGRPVVVCVASNDGLSGSAPAIGQLLMRKNIFFVPFGQDDPINKPTSLVADFDQIPQTIAAAFDGRQLQPLLL